MSGTQLNNLTGCGKHSWSQWYKRKDGKLTLRGFRPIAMLPTIYRIYSKTLQQLASDALQSRRGPQSGHVPGRQAHEVVWMLKRMVEQATEWQIPVSVMDCDVAAAFDHVSHHEIIKATMEMGVPPILIAAWIRECRNSETVVLLDDIVTTGIRRARSVLHGNQTCLVRRWTDKQKNSWNCAQKWCLPVGRGYMGFLLFADNCWIIGMSITELQTSARALYDLLKQSGVTQ